MKDDRPKLKQIRMQIAAAAARIMAEDGIEAYSLAKRKAARQLGAQDSRDLPADEEIEAELRIYQALYQGREHADHLHHLRTMALELMRVLDQFSPHLTGAVLNGTAGRFSGIDLQLFSDDPKAVELFLLNRDIPYETLDRRNFEGDQVHPLSILKVEWQGISAKLAVYGTLWDERSKFSPGGQPIKRAGIPAVTELLSFK